MKKRNILRNIAKVMAGSLLAATVLTAISPAMAAFADEPTSASATESVEAEEEPGKEVNDAGADTQTTEDENQADQPAANAGNNDTPKKEFPVPLDRTDGSITVNMEVEDPDKKDNWIQFNGGEIEIVRVATVKSADGFRFKLLEPFDGVDGVSSYEKAVRNISYLDPTLTDTEFNKLADMFKDKTGSESKKVTISNGRAVFNGFGEETDASLPLGLYLVRQTKLGSYQAEEFTPFLVSIPYYSTKDADGDGKLDAIYNVTVDPKLALRPELKLSSCIADPPVQKIAIGDNAPVGDKFTFIFMGGTPEKPVKDYPLPEGLATANDEYSVKLTVTTANVDGAIKSPDDANAEFGEIEFTKAGLYVYTLYEDTSSKLDGYTYDTKSYKITYDVKIDPANGLVVDSITAEASGSNVPVNVPFDNKKFARPAASQYTFVNTYKKQEEESTTVPETTRRKIPENTPRDRDPNPPTPTRGEEPTVAGAYREPEGEVLGAARTPQAVLGASRLPQTGQLWWPVPILMIAGITLMAGGLVKRKSEE